MSNSKILGVGSMLVLMSGCQSWQYQDVDSLPPTASLPQTSEPGIVQARYWNNVSGSKVLDLLSLPAYLDQPDEIITLTELRGETNRGDSYGALVRGYIIPPADGSYRFYVSGDDETQFWLSPSELISDAQMIASVPGWTPVGDYAKYASQRSPTQDLNAGERYYFEVRFKEGGGADHFTVAWEGPGFGRQVVGSDNLASLGQSVYPDEEGARTAYSIGYRVGFLDGSEGLDFNPSYPPLDKDQDGLYDNWEVIHGLSPADPGDPFSDPDGDLLSAADEFLLGTAENDRDTDDDGIPDGVEFAYGLDPRDPSDASEDADNDGYTNLEEYRSNTAIDDPEDTPYTAPAFVAGFVGQYFRGTGFNEFVQARHDGPIDFVWGSNAPMPELPVDRFSVRWSGLFTAPHTEGVREYEFMIRIDDGGRLYLNNERLIDQWRGQAPTVYRHVAAISVGETLPLTMEYYESAGGAVAELTITDLSNGQTLTMDAVNAPDPDIAHAQDTDGDGIPDTWELRHGLDPWQDDGSGISNASGVTNLQAYENGLDPWTLEPVPTPEKAPRTAEPETIEPAARPAGTATLSWTAPSTRVDGSSIALSEIDSYIINYGSSEDSLTESYTVSGDAESYTLTGLSPGTWYFQVRVVDTDGHVSDPSEVVSYEVR
ncbi:PA14 domain-containing protein [Marinobacter salicampi]|uniref:PA14 domain-containing protein n=1 Tax=Marinobacter salicampi TaxID=435907 RepID=UPI00140D643D|nr:PA14 domain-containing protein [Marinobacter salicampi]